MEQLAHRDQRIGRLDGATAVHRLIAELRDDACFAEYRFAGRSFEGGLVDKRAQVVLIGKPQ